MRSIFVIALLALLPCQVFAQTSAGSEVYALDAVSDHTARVGASNLFVYQTKGASLGKFLLGGALLNSHSIAKQSESLANSINGDSAVLDFGEIGKALEEKSADGPIARHAVLVSVDSDGITRATLIAKVKDGSERGTNYYYHFKPTLQNSELQSEAGAAFFKSIEAESPTAVERLVAAVNAPRGAGTPTKAQSDFMRIYGKIKVPFKGERYADLGDLSMVRIDGKPGAIRFELIDGVHLFQGSQVEYR